MYMYMLITHALAVYCNSVDGYSISRMNLEMEWGRETPHAATHTHTTPTRD